MISKLKFTDKSRKILKEIILNTFAFGLYTFTQQLLLMPILSRTTSDSIYASFIVFITVANVLTNSLGGQVGVTRQINYNVSAEDNNESNYFIIQFISSFIIIIVILITSIYLDYDFLSTIFAMYIVIISNIRFYLRAILRMNDKYKELIYQNILYLLGVVIGLALNYLHTNIWFPLLVGETIAFVYVLFKVKIKNICLKYTKNFKRISKTFCNFSFTSFLTNSVSFIDKLIIFPVLGSINLAIYNSANTVSKITAFVVNPVNDVILINVSKSKTENAGKIIKYVIKISIILALILCLVTIPFIYFTGYILYPQYIDGIVSIMIAVSFSSSLSLTALLMKSFILKYTKPVYVAISYLINLITLIILGYFSAKLFGLKGFVWSIVIVRFQMVLLFIFILLKSKKKYIQRYVNEF